MQIKKIFPKSTLETPIGEITDIEKIGEGGNSMVYQGKIHDKNIAIKVLKNDSNTKNIIRFKAEFLNMQYLDNRPSYIAQYIYLGIHKIENDEYLYILMKHYKKTLKTYRKEIGQNINEKEVKKLYQFLRDSLQYCHQNNIIHRDLKPENIFLDEDSNYTLGDFGIAHYPESFPIQCDTNKSDRLANYLFSAPEQLNKETNPITPSADIYAMGQILQWFITGETHRGTRRTSLPDYDSLPNFNQIIDKMLYNNPEERFQKIKDIDQYVQENDFETKYLKKAYKDLNSMLDFLDSLKNCSLGAENNIVSYDTPESIQNFLEYFSQENLNDLYYKALYQNKDHDNHIKTIRYEKEKIFIQTPLFNHLEITPSKIIINRSKDDYYKNFIYIESKGEFKLKEHSTLLDDIEEYCIFENQVYTLNEYHDGGARRGENRIFINQNKAEVRRKILTPYCLFIFPRCSSLNKLSDSLKSSDFLNQENIEELLKELSYKIKKPDNIKDID